jgi:hypothetical protein
MRVKDPGVGNFKVNNKDGFRFSNQNNLGLRENPKE